MVSRRHWLTTGTLAAGAALLSARAAAAPARRSARGWEPSYSGDPALSKGLEPGTGYRPVITPNNESLPYKVVDGCKVYHLIAEEVDHEFTAGFRAKCWGYNGKVHGPTLEAVEGDRVVVYVTNRLPAPTSVHWHGVFLPNGMDGVGGLTQKVIEPGQTFRYAWTFTQSGTFMYHSHHDEMTQMAMGSMGMIVVHPRAPDESYVVDRDFCILLSEWSIKVGASRPDPNEMKDFNVLTMNARVFPGTAPLVCKQGERVRIRFGNLSAMDHHPIHMHGHFFKVTATDGGRIPPSAQLPEATVLVPTGSTRDVQFVADAPGDWPLHCHMTHHVMNQMGHGIPNLMGVEAKGFDSKVSKLVPGYMTMGQTGMGEMGAMGMAAPKNSIPMLGGEGPHGVITMGGMFTLLKVRADLAGYADPGWYQAPAGTVARPATQEELIKDGIVV
jgi:manganese oxidase